MDRHTHTLTHAPHAHMPSLPQQLTLGFHEAANPNLPKARTTTVTSKSNPLFSQHKAIGRQLERSGQAKGKLLLLLRPSQTRGRFAFATALGVPTPRDKSTTTAIIRSFIRSLQRVQAVRPRSTLHSPSQSSWSSEDESCATLPGGGCRG
jgi:hypothetical protein